MEEEIYEDKGIETSTLSKVKTIGGANHSIWINTVEFNKFRKNSRLLHKKSASERIEAFVVSENLKDNGVMSVPNVMLEEQLLSDLRTCAVEIVKLKKVVTSDEKIWESMLRIAVSLGVEKM